MMLVAIAVAAAMLARPAASTEAGFHSLANNPLLEHIERTQDDSQMTMLQTRASAKAQRVQGYCEICIRMVQMKQRFQPDVCSGLTDNFFITVSMPEVPVLAHCRDAARRSRARDAWRRGRQRLPRPSPARRPPRPRPAQCVKNLESIIKADRAVSYWHNVGCVHLDAAGPEAVKPCPAHVICGWVPNIFGQRIRADGETMGQLAPLCPRDTNFVPRVPRTDAPAQLPFDFSKLASSK